MKKCEYCGREFSNNTIFCIGCGAKLISVAPPAPPRKKRRLWITALLAVLVVLSALIPITRWVGGEISAQKAQQRTEEFYAAASRLDTLQSYQTAVETCGGLAFVPPLVNAFLETERTEQEFLVFADSLFQAGYSPDALRVLSQGYQRLDNPALLQQIKTYWPMPCDVSKTFIYFNPVARMMGKTWDTMTWEDALQIKYLCIQQDCMGISFEEIQDYESIFDFLSKVKYAPYLESEVAATVGFVWDRYTMADNASVVVDGSFVQKEECRSSAIGVFMNVTFLQTEEYSYIPTSLIASLANLHTIYASEYDDYALRPDGTTEDLYAPLRSLSALRTLRGCIPMHNGLSQVTELEITTSSEFSGAHQEQVTVQDGKALWDVTPQGVLQKENMLFHPEQEQSFDLSGLYQFPSLTTLRLVHQMNELDLSILTNLPALRVLEVRDCRALKNMTSIASLSALESLSLSGLPNEEQYGFIEEMTMLQNLVLLPEKLFRAPDITKLPELRRLDTNLLYGAAFGRLTKLEELTAYRLDDCFALSGLEYLNNLTINGATGLEGIGALQNLKVLFLNKAVPQRGIEELAMLTNCEDLIVLSVPVGDAANAVEYLPNPITIAMQEIYDGEGTDRLLAALGKKSSLRSLIFSPTKQDMDTSTKYYEGDHIDISQLPDTKPERLRLNLRPYLSELSKLTELQILRLESSNLKDLDFLIPLTKLEELNVNDNVITDVSALSYMPALRELDTRNNLVGRQSVYSALVSTEVAVKSDDK